MLNDLWLYQSTPETPISPIILYLNLFCVKDPFLVLLLLSEADKAPFQTSIYLHTNTGMSDEYRFYISPYVEVVLVVSINHRDTNIVNKTVFEPILREYSVYGLSL